LEYKFKEKLHKNSELVGRMDVIANFFSSSSKVDTFYRIEGKHEFFIEPVVTKGKLPFHTCSISVKVFKNKEKLESLPVKIK